MNRNVKISVSGTQCDEGGNEVQTSCRASGQYYEKNNCRYLLYEEQDGESGAVTSNTLKIRDNVLELSRRGGIRSRMIFEAGRTCPAGYDTAYGSMQLEVYTESLKFLWTEDHASVIIIYNLLMAGGLLSRNRLVIEIDAA